MDVDKCLDKIRAHIKAARDAKTEHDARYACADAIRQFEELDKYLSEGGLLPDAWMGPTFHEPDPK